MLNQNSSTGSYQQRNAPRRLTQKEKDIVGDWLTLKSVKHECPVCDQNNWLVGDYLIQNASYIPGSAKPGAASYPAALVMCGNCAYLRTFMAHPLGLATS